VLNKSLALEIISAVEPEFHGKTANLTAQLKILRAVENSHRRHHHHPRISSRCKSWTKLQGRYVSRINLYT